MVSRLLALVYIAQCLWAAHCRSPSQEDWDSLNRTVHGHLMDGVPFAQPCFNSWNSSECMNIQNNYLEELTRSSSSSAYIETQWETCQKSGEQCLLNYLDPHDITPTLPPNKCGLGSVANYFIDVRDANDVIAALKFTNKAQIPLVVKNTGHDYKGRSSAPGSLALWTHNLKDMTYSSRFIPTGCAVQPRSAVTLGAGVQWGEAYAFADAHNITLVGGSDVSVGASGGWLQGGGHSMLSTAMGLGVDRVLEYKIVTPDGKLRTANECQNEDLFWALRGGGGGTFGVVLESTVLASPQVTLQVFILTFAPTTDITRGMWKILVENGLKWASEGWGGLSQAESVILVNPKLSQDEAKASLAPLIQFGEQLQVAHATTTNLLLTEFPSWFAFAEAFTNQFKAALGASLALTSRLVPKDLFETSETQDSLVSALVATETAAPGVIILITCPAAFPYVPGSTSVTEAWRSSLYHVTTISEWNWNATLSEKQSHYKIASDAIDNLRKITPDAAYQNEADVYEPNHEVSFWGDNYPKLLEIKQKYDPHRRFDCWQCVGWEKESPRFSCYL